MKIVITYVLLIITFQSNVFAQENTMNGNLAKYWYYRWRLKNDFMVMGEGQGMSLVAEQRNPERSNCIKWADGTIMHGYYLSMLAVEHRILSESGRQVDLNETNKELYYALRAFERLDYWTESIYSSEGNDNVKFRILDQPLRGDVNGYFFRDDVPPNFINEGTPPVNIYNSRYQKLNSGRTGINYGIPVNYTSSDFSKNFSDDQSGVSYPRTIQNSPNFPIVDYNYGNNGGGMNLGEPSQDQIIRLLLGFTMIVKSIPDQTYTIDLDGDGYSDVTMNFQEQARRHATNIIGRISDIYSGTKQVHIDNNEYHSFNNNLGGWFIRSPREIKCFPGGYISGYAPPIRLMSYMLFTDNNDLGITSASTINSRLPNGFIGFQNVWNNGGPFLGYNDHTNAKMALTLNVISNSGNTPHFWSSVPRSIYEESHGNGNHEWRLEGYFIPLYDYLWGWDPDKKKDKERLEDAYEQANSWLNVAPCQGPHNFAISNHTYADNSGEIYQGIGMMSPEQYGTSGIPPVWNSPFLFDTGYDIYSDGLRDVEVNDCGFMCNYTLENQNAWEGWFSGVDYMLLYNILYANNDGSKPLYHNLINRIVDYEVNTNSNLSTVLGEQHLLGGFENLRLRSKIHGNNSIEVKALDFVQLENGAEVDPEMSGIIEIFTDQLKCSASSLGADNEQYGLAACSSCGLDAQVGSEFIPQFDREIPSLDIENANFHLSDITEITEENFFWTSEELHTVVYPNPVTTSFQINSSSPITSLEILDISGSLIVSFSNDKTEYDLSNLSSGVYFVVVHYLNNATETIKITKL